MVAPSGHSTTRRDSRPSRLPAWTSVASTSRKSRTPRNRGSRSVGSRPPAKHPSRNAPLVPTRVDFGCASLKDREPELLENTRGRRVAVQSRRADFRNAEGTSRKLDQEASQLGTEALTPERGEDRVPDGGYARKLGMPANAAHSDEIAVSPERATQTMVATGRRRCPAELARLLDRDRPLDPEKGSRDPGARVQRFHERRVTFFEPAQLESVRSMGHRRSHSRLPADPRRCGPGPASTPYRPGNADGEAS